MISEAPDDTTDTAVLFVRRIHEHWRGIDTNSLVIRAMAVYTERSKDGFLQFKSDKGIQKVKVSGIELIGPSPDMTMRLSAQAIADGQKKEAELVVDKDDNRALHFDSIILVEPQGKVSYGWSEAESVWIAGKGANPNP